MFTALLVTAVLAGSPTRSVAVLDIAAKAGFEKDIADLFNEVLQKEIRDRGFKVIGKSDIEAVLGLEKLKDALACDSTSCLAEVGGALGADEIVTGALAHLDKGVLVTLKRIDPKNSRVVAQALRTVEVNTDRKVLDHVAVFADELYGGGAAPAENKVIRASEVMFSPREPGDSFEIAVKTAAQLYRCLAAVTSATPCRLTLPPGEALVMSKNGYQATHRFSPGETQYRLKYRKRWPWLTWLIGGTAVTTAAVLLPFLARNGCDPTGRSNPANVCSDFQQAAIPIAAVGGIVGLVSIIGGSIGVALSGDHSEISEPKAETAW